MKIFWKIIAAVASLFLYGSGNPLFYGVGLLLFLPLGVGIFMRYKTAFKWFLPIGVALSGTEFFSYLTGAWASGGQLSEFFLIVLYLSIIMYYIKMPKKKRMKKIKGMPGLSSNKMEQYKKAGLDDGEIRTFRQTMASLQKDIRSWEESIEKNGKLQAIELNAKGLKMAKILFKEIVKSPQRMGAAGGFIYQHVPTMAELSRIYVDIAEHESKTAETLGKLQESAEVIRKLSEEIVKDYQKFVSTDIEDLEVQLAVAKKAINSEATEERSSTKEELVEGDLAIPDFSRYLEKIKEKQL